MTIQKSALTEIARAIKNIDSSLWHFPRYSNEYDLASNARKNLFKLICENGYELQAKSYRLIKTKQTESDSKFLFIGNERIEYWYTDEYTGEMNDSDIEHIQSSLKDGIVEGELITYNGDEESEHYGWWKIVR